VGLQLMRCGENRRNARFQQVQFCMAAGQGGVLVVAQGRRSRRAPFAIPLPTIPV
jgi:hypothetical protein